jgi:hypothetical protein
MLPRKDASIFQLLKITSANYYIIYYASKRVYSHSHYERLCAKASGARGESTSPAHKLLPEANSRDLFTQPLINITSTATSPHAYY